MAKCTHCSKLIAKKNPGLECNKCSVIVHATAICSGLTAKQLNSLRSAENLEWTCRDCSQKSPRKSSFITLQEEAEDDEEVQNQSYYPFDMKKLLNDLTTEINKIIKKELRETNTALQYCSDKVDEFLECMEAFKDKVKQLEKKTMDLENKYKSTENKIGALEQRLNEYEQRELNKNIEIIGIPYLENENLEEISKAIAKKLHKDVADIKKIKRVSTPPGRLGKIKFEMYDEIKRNNWIKEAKSAQIYVNNILTTTGNKEIHGHIYIREELTYYNRTLLWNAKQRCKDKFKFVWCKEGKILVRKSEKSKIFIIRNDEDLKELLK